MNLVAISPPGPMELVIILLILVLVFGARRLPELGQSVGKTIKGFRKGMDEAFDDEESDDASTPSEPTQGGPSNADRE